ncbi:MAG: alpha/beta hydrolase [Planctomycetaceae bacterium]|nr:MAG: alpha/beta hydrolase [Planctomycetaceae bacterium]
MRCRKMNPVRLMVMLLGVFGLALDSSAGQRYEDVVYARRGEGVDAIELVADIELPPGEGPFPAVICVHGGAWRVGNKQHMSHVVPQLIARGYATMSISYRLAPAHPFPAQQQDCHEALRWLYHNAARYKIDPQRIAGLGYSAGGQMVLLEALAAVGEETPPWVNDCEQRCEVRFRAVVAGGTPCDFRSLPLDTRALAYWLGGTRREFPERYRVASPAAFISGDAPPIYFFHGQQDVMVPRTGMLEMAERLRQAGTEVHVDLIPDHGHITAFFHRPAYQGAIDFLDRHLQE